MVNVILCVPIETPLVYVTSAPTVIVLVFEGGGQALQGKVKLEPEEVALILLTVTPVGTELAVISRLIDGQVPAVLVILYTPLTIVPYSFVPEPVNVPSGAKDIEAELPGLAKVAKFIGVTSLIVKVQAE